MGELGARTIQRHGQRIWNRARIELQHEPIGPMLAPAGRLHSSNGSLQTMGASRFRRDRLRQGRHVGVWAPAIACKTKVANDNLALAA